MRPFSIAAIYILFWVLSAFTVLPFGLRSARLFGKAIPGLGGVLGALSDRKQLNRIAEAARKGFPQVG